MEEIPNNHHKCVNLVIIGQTTNLNWCRISESSTVPNYNPWICCVDCVDDFVDEKTPFLLDFLQKKLRKPQKTPSKLLSLFPESLAPLRSRCSDPRFLLGLQGMSMSS